jgi:pseudouridine-5'-phosphate glycosidase
MEYPVNRDTALAVENIVRDNGAIPATIAIIAGVIKVGLTGDDIELLSKEGRHNSRKCSRRDLAFVLARKMNGSTTVAGTMYLANLAGIKVFVTGGIGGVHRGAEQTFDISADLLELSKTPVNVISAGVKSILDIPKTLEYLETMGVPVVSY